MNLTWRKRIVIWRNRLYLYPPPEAMPRTLSFWIATGLVALLAILFAAYFILYLTGRHDAYITSAEDLGIVDQAVWSVVHGQLLHQTICDIVSDTNCYSVQGISRFAIHFEPILFPVSLLYLLWPNPKTLLVLQTLVVASGAFPAFWLARLRLRNEWAAVVIALLYLLYPAQQQATIYDFHAVTFTAALLLFTLYFMYTRRTTWMFVCAILAMACKEEMPLVIILLGLWSALFQQRWRSGLALSLLAAVWLVVGYYTMHVFSPTGHPLLIARYAALGSSPLSIAKHVLLHPFGILRTYVFEHYHEQYLRILLAPVAYLPLLAPWALVLAVPSLALNLLSSNYNMYSGYFQYNAEIVPMLIFATIEGIVVLLWLAQWVTRRLLTTQGSQAERKGPPAATRETQPIMARSGARLVHLALLVVIMATLLYQMKGAVAARGALPFSSFNMDGFQGLTEYSPQFQWPASTPHINLAQRFIDMIPASASVSAQSHLVPHVSERTDIYLFPYGDDHADYIFLDVTGNTYPLLGFGYIREVKKVLFSGNYGVAAAQDGYLLLKRGLPPPGISPYSAYNNPQSGNTDVIRQLPASFCSFTQVKPSQVQEPMNVTFSAADGAADMNLVGVHTYAFNTTLQLNTFWRVGSTPRLPVRLLVVATDKTGKDHFVSIDFPALSWCPTNTWQPGTTFAVMTDVLSMGGIPKGLAHISLALLPTTHPFSTIMNVQDWFSTRVSNASANVRSDHNGKALRVASVSIF